MSTYNHNKVVATLIAEDLSGDEDTNSSKFKEIASQHSKRSGFGQRLIESF